MKIEDCEFLAELPAGYEAGFFLGDIYAFSENGPVLHLNHKNEWKEVQIKPGCINPETVIYPDFTK